MQVNKLLLCDNRMFLNFMLTLYFNFCLLIVLHLPIRKLGYKHILAIHTILDVTQSSWFFMSCPPPPRRVIYSRNLDICSGDVSNSRGKLSIQVCFKMRGLVSIIFLIHLVITQGDNSDKTWNVD